MLKRSFSLPQIFSINFILLLVGVLVMTSLIIYYTLRQIEITQYTNQLKSETAYIRARMDEGKSLEEAAREMSKIMGRHLRVTLIKMDGTVLFDNEADPRSMENHANRPEVMAAKRTGFGTVVRYSHTVKNDRIYVAKKILFNEKPAILRLSVSFDTVMKDFTTLWVRIATIFATALLLGFAISFLMQKRIGEELGKLTDYLAAINEKKYHARFSAGFSKEFTTIAAMLKKLAKRLEKNEKKKRKYNAKIRLISKQRSEMISAISHEFKNPVAAIIGYTETMLDDDHLPSNIRRKFLERIDQNATRITQMIDRLSFMTRMESAEVIPEMSDFDFTAVVEDAVEMMERKYNGRHVHLKVKTKQVYLHADRTMMEMTVINLLDNALKYSEEDVTIRLDEKSFCIEDQGVGIPENEIEAITKKYYRLDKHSWDNSMGLGLAIVSFILKRHHTQLHIRSEMGVGTTICFELPSICPIKKNEVSSKFI